MDDKAIVPMDGNVRQALVKISLPPEKAELVPQVVSSLVVSKAPVTQLVMFGQEPIQKFSSQLDQMLAQISETDSPVLFQLFKQISTSVKEMNLPQLEVEIRKRLEGSPLDRVLNFIGLGDRAEQLQEAADQISALLQSKANSLLEIVRPMEKQIATESTNMIEEINRLGQLAEIYRGSILDLGIYVEAGRQILHGASEELVHLEEEARTTGDPLKVNDVREFHSRLEVFTNRLMTLETAYVTAPIDLESIGISQNASLMALVDTVNTGHSELNAIKSTLLRLHSLFQTKSLMEITAMRRNLRAQLQKYSLQQLEEVAVDAASLATDGRLEAAKLLVDSATVLQNISNKVEEVRIRNLGKTAEATALLVQAQQVVSQLDHPQNSSNQPIQPSV